MGAIPGTSEHGSLAAWRQGSTLPSGLLDKARAQDAPIPSLGPGDFACTITQSCDLIHPSFREEPFFEALIVRQVPQPDGNYWHGKNPRRIQFELYVEGDSRLYEAYARERVMLDRQLLLQFQPAGPPELTPDVVREVVHWVTKRYRRHAFPDAFNSRVGPAVERVAKALKKGGQSITGLFLRLDPSKELPEGENYRVILVATTLPPEPGKESQEEATECFDKIAAALAQCDGIELMDDKLVSEDDFSLTHLREFPRWDYDHLSLAAESEASIAPDHP